MSGRNILLVLIAALAAIGLFVFATNPGQAPVVPIETPSIIVPRTTPPPAPTVDRDEGTPVLDDVAKDAAAEVERLKSEQQDMNEMPVVPVPEPPTMVAPN